MNPDTIGCVWTGEFDFNTLRVDGDIFKSGKKKLRIQKYPDKWGRSLKSSIKFAGTHLYSREKRRTVRVKWLAQNTKQRPRTALETGQLDLETSALNMKPPRTT